MTDKITQIWKKIDFRKLSKCFNTYISKDTIIFIKSTNRRNKFCQMAYPRHPKGCKNYDRYPLCPPKIPIRTDILEIYNYFNLVYIRFDYKQYLQIMKEQTKDNEYWTENRQKSVIYWQHSLKRLLKNYIKEKGFIYDEIFGCGSGFLKSPSMESIGINVFSTLKRNMISYEIKPQNSIILVCLLVSKHKQNIKQSNLDKFSKDK